jgi:hypothetical protein
MRGLIGRRDDHHPNCSKKDGKPCDCYAKDREKYHAALDRIVAIAKVLA